MAQRDLINRSLDAGKDVTQRTQELIETLVRDVAKTAEDQAAQAQSLVQELVDRSRATTEQLVETVDREIRNQLSSMGLATKADVARLERSVDRLRGRVGDAVTSRRRGGGRTMPAVSTASAASSATKTAAKAASSTTKKAAKAASSTTKTAAKAASTAKKATAKKASTAKKAATKKAVAKTASTAKKSAAKKASTTTKKAATKKSAAKKAAAKKAAGTTRSS